jgi:hypothetical protein
MKPARNNPEKPPERRAAANSGGPAAHYALRLLATVGISIGGLTLLLYLALNASNILAAGVLVLLLVPLVRIVGDAMNPDVPNPASLAGYLSRYLAVLLFLSTYLLLLLALIPALALALGLLGGALFALLALVGLLFWALQHGLGLQVAREMASDEWRGLLLLLGAAIAGGGVCLGLLRFLLSLKDRLEPRFWQIIHTLQARLSESP